VRIAILASNVLGLALKEVTAPYHDAPVKKLRCAGRLLQLASRFLVSSSLRGK
jgi:hypothetical protein